MKEQKLQQEDIKTLSSQLYPIISIQNQIHLSDKRKNKPGIVFEEDSEAYFNPNTNAIHIGINAPIDIFNVQTPSEYVSALNYVYGHENQHVRSTAFTPYVNGINKSCFSFIEYVARELGDKKLFRTQKDYEDFTNNVLPNKYNVRLNYQLLRSIFAGVMNSIEDGRIERIRSIEFEGFEAERRYFRAKFWVESNVDIFPPYEDLSSYNKLTLILNSILTLATTSLYPKGFLAKYGNTKLFDEVQEIMPHIAKGVMSKRTRSMANHAVDVSFYLFKYLYELCIVERDRELEKLLKDLIDTLAKSSFDPSETPSNTLEQDEEQDEDNSPLSPFPHSDLSITLSDEEFDKLEEKMKERKQKGKNKGGSIEIKREHPKENDCQDNKSSQEGEGSQESKKSQEGESSQKGNSQKGSSQESKEEREGEGQNKEGSNSQETPSNSQENLSNSKDSSSNQGDKERRNKDGKSSKPFSDAKKGNRSSGKNEGGTYDDVLEAMKEAAKDIRLEANEIIDNINQASTYQSKLPTIIDNSRTITNDDVKDIIHSGFKEFKRQYNIDQDLPPVLKARAKAFRKKNERYFKSLSTPNISHLESGSIDPSLIYGLTFGETNVFRKLGEDRKFDGCVYLLVDNSGSMSGNKRIEACKAAAVVEEGFKGIIPMKIVAFDEHGEIVHEVIKGWDESHQKNCCWNFALHGRQGCGNEDDKDILVAQKELLERPEAKKALIILSDGAPTSTERVRKVVEETRKKGINVFSIYFEEGQVGDQASDFQYMYQKDYVCCELSQVDQELTKLLIKFSRS